jgi:hypothetical protein
LLQFQSVSSEASVEDSESSTDEVEEESEGGSVKCRPAKGTQFTSDLLRRRASLRVSPEKKKDGRGRKRVRSESGLKEEEKEIKNKTARKLIKNAINKVSLYTLKTITNRNHKIQFLEPEIAEDFSNSARHPKEHAKTVFDQSLLIDCCTCEGRVENCG